MNTYTNIDIINKIKTIDKNNIDELNNLYNELIKDNKKHYIDYLFYSLKKYEHKEIIEDEIIEDEIIKENIEEREKRQDALYRKLIQNKYKTCMITSKPLCVSQVAHIYPHRLCTLEEKYDPVNGFLLSAELHILFDSTDNKLKIDPETQIISFCKEILEDETMAEYKKYHNKKIELNDKQKYYLTKKYKIYDNKF